MPPFPSNPEGLQPMNFTAPWGTADRLPRAPLTGYLHPAYAESLSEFGEPTLLPNCGGWILKRVIPNTGFSDGMGCYPLFACRDWSQLGSDLNDLRENLVSLSLVADPFGVYDPSQLRSCFDVFVPFKQHFVVDYDLPHRPRARHRDYARWAEKRVHVEVAGNSADFSPEWVILYSHLARRHNLSGIKAFSPRSLSGQLQVPGAVLFRATHDGTAVAAHLWLVSGSVAYSHLVAGSDLAFQLRASYAMYASAIEYFRGKVRFLDLGAGAGTVARADDGLAQFKGGWGNATRPAYFCGRVLNGDAYKQLAALHSTGTSNYFPAYRAGEFF
jgi:hypothetical protein